MNARVQADTDFLAREIATVRLSLSDVVTTEDLTDAVSQLTIGDRAARLRQAAGLSCPPRPRGDTASTASAVSARELPRDRHRGVVVSADLEHPIARTASASARCFTGRTT